MKKFREGLLCAGKTEKNPKTKDREEQMKRNRTVCGVILALVVLAMLGFAVLHLFPSVENWLHQITGWY